MSLATDLATGMRMERGIRACLVAARLAERLGLPAGERANLFYFSLLSMLGCTAGASDAARLFGDEIAAGPSIAPAVMGTRTDMLGWMFRHLGEGRPLGERAVLLGRM